MNPARILIVEDEILLAKDLARRLQGFGYEVVGTCSTGEDAVRAATEYRPHLVVMDIRLSGSMNGIEAARQIRSGEGPAIVYLTALTATDAFERAKATEPYGYLIKPVSPTDLRRTVEMALYRKEMENRIRESERRWKEFAELLPQVVYEIDRNYLITFMNRSGLEALGYQREEIFGILPAVRLICPEDRERAAENMSKALRGETLHDNEYTALRKDGRTFPISAYSEPVYEDGVIVGVRGVCVDITERKEAERLALIQRDLSCALNAAGNTTQAIDLCLDAVMNASSMDAGAIYLRGPDGDLTLRASRGLSVRFQAAKGRVPSDSVRGRLVSTGEPVYYRIHPECPTYDDAVEAEGLKAVGSVPVVHAGSVIACINCASKTLDEIPAKSRRSMESIAGIFGGALARLEAKAELLRAHRELMLSETEKRAILDAIDELVAYQDREGRIVWANRAAEVSAGKDPGELKGLRCFSVWEQRTDRCPECPVLEAFKTGEAHAVERRISNGTYWWLRGYPVKNETGDVVGVVEVGRNLTDMENVRNAYEKGFNAYRKLLERLPCAMVEIDSEALIRFADSRWTDMLGFEPHDLVGTSLLDLMGSEQDRLELRRLCPQTSDARSLGGESVFSLLAIDGEIVPLRLTWSTQFDDRGKPVGTILMSVDSIDDPHPLTTNPE